MQSNPERRRRWIGVTVLGTAVLMLVAGETVLKGSLGPVAMLAYWLGFFALPAIQFTLAIAHAGAVARRTTEARRDLVSRTVKEIEQHLKDRDSKPED
jgi:hypothetical protein